MLTKTPYPHECFRDEMIYDADFNEWQCRVCRRKYHPPQVPIIDIPRWRPWLIPIEKLCLPVGLYWRPEKDYRAWVVRREIAIRRRLQG